MAATVCDAKRPGPVQQLAAGRAAIRPRYGSTG